MHSKRIQSLSPVFLGLLFSGIACTSLNWHYHASRSRQSGNVGTRITGAPMNTAGDNEGVRLFGRDSEFKDVSFEARAASDLQQHTTPSDGADFDPDTDPTGKSLVYASTRHATNSHLYIKSITGATITQITDGPANDAQPEFDPTGDRIAFSSDRAGHWDIWIVDINGRNPIQITNSPMPELHPSWSPDGNKLVYCRINPKENRSALWVVELENPGVKRLIGDGLFPAWSPKGDKIVYQRARARDSHRFSIWTVDVFDDEVLFPTEIAASPTEALIAPTWSPDGSQLAFSLIAADQPTAGRKAGPMPFRQTDIALVDIDGRGIQRLTHGDSENHSPTWSTNGRIYFSTRQEDSETIWSVKPFRPIQFDDPPSATTAGTRQSASVTNMEIAE
ncbi:MAG: TolB family protein [Phycisphaerae bacterium]